MWMSSPSPFIHLTRLSICFLSGLFLITIIILAPYAAVTYKKDRHGTAVFDWVQIIRAYRKEG